MNLEQIRLRREAEMAASGSLYLEPTPRPRPKGHCLCYCGSCPRCRFRIANTQYRERKKAGLKGPPPGPKTDAGKRCRVCRQRLANHNRSGLCTVHYRSEWHRKKRREPRG